MSARFLVRKLMLSNRPEQGRAISLSVCLKLLAGRGDPLSTQIADSLRPRSGAADGHAECWTRRSARANASSTGAALRRCRPANRGLVDCAPPTGTLRSSVPCQMWAGTPISAMSMSHRRANSQKSRGAALAVVGDGWRRSSRNASRTSALSRNRRASDSASMVANRSSAFSGRIRPARTIAANRARAPAWERRAVLVKSRSGGS